MAGAQGLDRASVSETSVPLARYAVGWLAGALPALSMITLLWLFPKETTPFGDIGLGVFALAFPVMVRRLKVPRRTGFVGFLLAAGIAFSVLSIFTGWGNGLTDEGFTTPRFAGFLLSGHDPYTTTLVFDFTQYGKSFTSTSYYVYLPLLMFLQIPGISYKWFSVLCWALGVVVVRKRFDTAVLLAQPYVMLVAASGYNDLVVLLLLTVGFVGIEGRRQKWAEWLALGCKQFANAFVLLYYAVRRDWRNLLVTAGISGAFILPFVLWGGTAVVCPAVFANRLSSCAHSAGPEVLLNYPVWAVWVVAVFYVPVAGAIRSAVRRPRVAAQLARWGLAPERSRRLPSIVVVGASAIILGLSVFVLVALGVGPRGWGAVLSGAVAAPAVVLWSYAWGSPWEFDRAAGFDRAATVRRMATSQLVTVAIDLGILSAWAAGRGPTLAGEAAGLLVGVVVGYALAWRWRLFGSVGAAAPPVATSGP
jgi:putative flippase GtrA